VRFIVLAQNQTTESLLKNLHKTKISIDYASQLQKLQIYGQK